MPSAAPAAAAALPTAALQAAITVPPLPLVVNPHLTPVRTTLLGTGLSVTLGGPAASTRPLPSATVRPAVLAGPVVAPTSLELGENVSVSSKESSTAIPASLQLSVQGPAASLILSDPATTVSAVPACTAQAQASEEALEEPLDYGDLEELLPLSLQEKAASPAAEPASTVGHKPVSTSVPISDPSATAGLSKSEPLRSPQSRLDSSGPSKSSAAASSKPAVASSSAVPTPVSQAAASKPALTPTSDPAPASKPDSKPASKPESKKGKKKKASSEKPAESDPPTTAEEVPVWGSTSKRRRSQLPKSDIPASDSASVDSGKPTLPASTVPADLVPALTPDQIRILELQEQIDQITRKSQ